MQKTSILVLDDCEDLLGLTVCFIEKLCGCTAVTARSLADVQRQFETVLTCELAILDINLDEGQPNGIDVYYWMRANGFQARIVFLTGHARTYPLVTEAERLGDVKIFSKPLPASTLIKIVQNEPVEPARNPILIAEK